MTFVSDQEAAMATRTVAIGCAALKSPIKHQQNEGMTVTSYFIELEG